MKRIILASASPRRREILQTLGLTFSVRVADVDESCEERDPARLCRILAARKGDAVAQSLLAEGQDLGDVLVIASDTVVAVGDGEKTQILGKPRDADDARRMLRLLSGRTHRVMSGIYLCSGKTRALSHDETEVDFDPLSEADIERYIASGEPFGKVGAYAIQGRASTFISAIRGDYFNVVGLPVHKMSVLFRSAFLQGK